MSSDIPKLILRERLSRPSQLMSAHCYHVEAIPFSEGEDGTRAVKHVATCNHRVEGNIAMRNIHAAKLAVYTVCLFDCITLH